MQIRKPKVSEAKEISELLTQTIKKVNSKDSPSEQITEWLKRNTPEVIKSKISDKNRSMFILIDKGVIVAYLCMFLKSNLLASLYVKNDCIGKGYGKKLLKFGEEYAKKKGLTELKLDSSPTAYKFYLSQGYITVKKGFHELNGVKLPITEMIKKL
jgi:N-acetylglutamate synthase-like GNAT family acetyltransferase